MGKRGWERDTMCDLEDMQPMQCTQKLDNPGLDYSVRELSYSPYAMLVQCLTQ